MAFNSYFYIALQSFQLALATLEHWGYQHFLYRRFCVRACILTLLVHHHLLVLLPHVIHVEKHPNCYKDPYVFCWTSIIVQNKGKSRKKAFRTGDIHSHRSRSGSNSVGKSPKKTRMVIMLTCIPPCWHWTWCM